MVLNTPFDMALYPIGLSWKGTRLSLTRSLKRLDANGRYWEASIFKYLRCEPEDTYFLLVPERLIAFDADRCFRRSRP